MADEEASEWEGRSAAEMAAAWSVPAVHLYRSVGSSNDVARALAQAGAPGGTVVLADEQRSGRGRVGREWDSPPGLGLWVSLVARGVDATGTGPLPLLVGLAAARALDGFAAPHRMRLKWPNDLYLRGRKLGGILCEATWEGSAPAFVVVGIGINVLHRATQFPEALRNTGTSLYLASGTASRRGVVADALVTQVAATLRRPLSLDDSDLREWAARDALGGQRVEVCEPETGTAIERGTVAGITRGGALLLETGAGALRAVHSGTVRLAGAPPPGL